MSKACDINYRSILLRELATRTRRNPGYSLRAFARDIQVPAPKLSQALRGIKGFSGQRAKAIATRLNLSRTEQEFFVDLVESEHARSEVGRHQAKQRVIEKIKETGFAELDLERFQLISDWFHFAILELTEVRGFSSNPAWISDRLGISIQKTKAAVERLIDFGLLAKNNQGVLKQTVADLAIPGEVSSRSVREQHSQLLQKADMALDSFALAERDFSAITLAVSSDDIPKAKKLIKTFRRTFNQEMQAAAQKDRVYCISIQFFPLDQKPKECLQ